jgi:hypothetical protein
VDPRACDACGTIYQPKRATSRFCPNNGACRVAYKRGKRPPVEAPPVGDDEDAIAPALREEFEELGVLKHYEARTALKLARQLDSGAIVGSAFTSLSKELDRRVDALRLKGDLPNDDPGQAIQERFQEKLRLIAGAQ